MEEELKKIDYSISEQRRCGRMVPLEEALNFFELYLPDSLPEEIKTEEFCLNYQRALNRVKYEALKHLAIKPKVREWTPGRGDHYSCGDCGHELVVQDNYCPACGTEIKWNYVRCLTK